MSRVTTFLGILGGTVGTVGILLAYETGTLATSLMHRTEAETLRVVLLALGLVSIGMLGAIIAPRRRVLGATALLVAGTGGLLAVSYFFLVPTALFVTAAVLAARRPEPTQTRPPRAQRAQSIVCPRCDFRFGVPLTRPLAVQCPSCGKRGTLSGSAVTPSSRNPVPQS